MTETDNIDEAIIDYDVSLIDRGRIDLAWRMLCAHMIYAAVAAHRVKVTDSCSVENRIAARKWMDGGGVISFEEACETANISMDRIRGLIYDENGYLRPINKGRRKPDAATYRPDQTVGGLVAAGSAFAEACGGLPGAATGCGGGGCPPFSVEQD